MPSKRQRKNLILERRKMVFFRNHADQSSIDPSPNSSSDSENDTLDDDDASMNDYGDVSSDEGVAPSPRRHHYHHHPPPPPPQLSQQQQHLQQQHLHQQLQQMHHQSRQRSPLHQHFPPPSQRQSHHAKPPRSRSSSYDESSMASKRNSYSRPSADDRHDAAARGSRIRHHPQHDSSRDPTSRILNELEDLEGSHDLGGSFSSSSSTSLSDYHRDRNGCQRLLNSLLCFFPKVEPLPWCSFFILAWWCAVPPVGYIIFFTQMGFGEDVYYVLAETFGHQAYSLAIVLALFIFTLYMLDADEWKSRLGSVILDLSLILIIVGFVLLVLFIADKYPYGTVCLFALFNPLWLLTIKLMFYWKKDTRVYVSWLSGPLFFVSVLIGMTWTIWVFWEDENQWNTVARMEAAERTGCEPIYIDYPECRKEEDSDETCFYVHKDGGQSTLVFPEGCNPTCTNVYNNCLNGFILWVGPVLVSMTMFFLSFFCTFFRTEGTKEKDVLNFGKVWIFILFAMWVTASLAGTAAGVTSALAALTLASFVASAMFLSVSFSKEERSQNLAAIFERLRQKYGKHLDTVRGLFIATCAPIILLYFGLSIMNQFIRKSGCNPFSQPAYESDDEREQADIFTTRTRKQIKIMKSWDRAKVYTYAVYWGIAFMVLQVIVAKLTVVFLSWLIEQTSEIGLYVVTGILSAAGVIMFLLPPVPGVPVYLTLGIVIPAQGHKIFGWAGSVAYAVVVGLALKLFSSAIQQKVIGEGLSRYVQVRQFVGINSTLMKSMRLVLDTDGLNVPKVAILVGGPDWPTSVLCGIMRLSLFQILLGTIPIVLLIIPTCLTGTFLYMASLETDSGNPQFAWASTVSTITASLTAVVQFGSMIIAAFYMEQTADKHEQDADSLTIDQEVLEADEKVAHLKKCYKEVTKWRAIPSFPKVMLVSSLTCIVTSSYMVQIFSSHCFVEHSLTDSIGENLDGHISNLFLPLGWFAIVLFVISSLCLYVFKRWGRKKARKLADGTIVSVADAKVTKRRTSAENFRRSIDDKQQSMDDKRYANKDDVRHRRSSSGGYSHYSSDVRSHISSNGNRHPIKDIRRCSSDGQTRQHSSNGNTKDGTGRRTSNGIVRHSSDGMAKHTYQNFARHSSDGMGRHPPNSASRHAFDGNIPHSPGGRKRRSSGNTRHLLDSTVRRQLSDGNLRRSLEANSNSRTGIDP